MVESTSENPRVGAFGALYFAAAAIGDARHREQFLDDELERLSSVTAAWAYYRSAVDVQSCVDISENVAETPGRA
jgi:hypothetical protein